MPRRPTSPIRTVQVAFLLAQGAAAALAAVWWLECRGTEAIIAVVATALCVLAARLDGRGLALWVHGAVLAHLVLGLRLDLYERTASYDDLAHLLAMAGLVGVVLARLDRTPAGREMLAAPGARLAVSAVLALALGAAWELFESLLDWLFALGAQRSLADTNLDLLWDLAGGVLAFAITWRAAPRPGATIGGAPPFRRPPRGVNRCP